jgi:DNA-binding MarR family transcriptional regulator
MDGMAADEIIHLLDEVRLLFHRAAQVAEQLHRDEPVTAGGRAVLELLRDDGPLSASEIARRRHVTRQHIQTLANALLSQGLVTANDNPAHRRSPLLSLTPAGTTVIGRMTARERQFLDHVHPAAGREELAQARRTLASVRAAIGATDDHTT